MTELRTIQTEPGLAFDVAVDGQSTDPLVLMLHGFGVSRHFWSAQLPALAAAGFYAAAPNQRGYAPGARPDPADFDAYRIDRLIGDALALADQLNATGQKIHLVGHDWGGSLAWIIAHRHPGRLASLTMLSRPHPAAFARALQTDPEQPTRSRHHTAFLEPEAGPRLLADNADWLRSRLARNGVPPAAVEAHMSVLANPPAIEAALAWYRARGERSTLGPITVPTLFIWGDADDTVGRIAAEGTAEFIAAPYQFAVLPGVGHYAADQAPDQVNALLLAHLARHPA
jgi:pimeloyl-ACP methyl ester carboxylesterase